MKKTVLIALGALLTSGLVVSAAPIHLRGRLRPSEEIPTNVTSGSGTFTAAVNDNNTVSFTLSYSNLSTPAVQAHIHLGATKTNGGVMVFLCGSAASPAHMVCPNDSTNSGTLTDTLSASDVVINGQGIQPGDLAKVLEAIHDGNAYVNVHTTQLPGGEMRGQVTVVGD